MPHNGLDFLSQYLFCPTTLQRHNTRRYSLRVRPLAAILLGLLAILAVDGVDLGNDSGNFFRD